MERSEGRISQSSETNCNYRSQQNMNSEIEENSTKQGKKYARKKTFHFKSFPMTSERKFKSGSSYMQRSISLPLMTYTSKESISTLNISLQKNVDHETYEHTVVKLETFLTRETSRWHSTNNIPSIKGIFSKNDGNMSYRDSTYLKKFRGEKCDSLVFMESGNNSEEQQLQTSSTTNTSMETKRNVSEMNAFVVNSIKFIGPRENTKCISEEMQFFRSYEKRNIIGSGGYGIVYHGVRKNDGLDVAIKEIEERNVERWKTENGEIIPMEVHIHRRVKDIPGILHMLNSFYFKKKYFIVMEKLEFGVELYKMIEEKPIDEAKAKKIFYGLVKTIVSCLKIGILYNDLIANNIIVDKRTYDSYLIDFGAATELKDIHSERSMALRGSIPLQGFKSDYFRTTNCLVWNLGILLFYMLTSNVPCLKKSELICQRYGSIMSIVMSEECQNVIKKCLSNNPLERPKIEDLLRDEWLSDFK